MEVSIFIMNFCLAWRSERIEKKLEEKKEKAKMEEAADLMLPEKEVDGMSNFSGLTGIIDDLLAVASPSSTPSEHFEGILFSILFQ